VKRRCVCCGGVVVSDDPRREEMLCAACQRDLDAEDARAEHEYYYGAASVGIDGGAYYEGEGS
jgi:hypothetical protein